MVTGLLKSAAAPLWHSYDVAVLDLDGVVYIGGAAVPSAAEALAAAEREGMHLAFVTNNAARPPAQVGQHLRDLGVGARNEDVVTSSQAAARVLSTQLPAGASVFVIGGQGLHEALAERGLVGVTEPGDDVVAVAQGYGPQMPWRQVIDGAILVARGLPWVATNLDMTFPTPEGQGPGNGSLVKLVADFARREPVVAGKPESPLFEETLLRVGGTQPLVIGDRLDTDIEGAVRLGWDSLLVMTGVTGLGELVACSPEQRPTYVGTDLRSLGTTPVAPTATGSTWRCGRWRAEVVEGRLTVTGEGGAEGGAEDSADDSALDSADAWWQVVAAVAWHHLDTEGTPVCIEGIEPPRSGAAIV